jgi:hypothetical protein
MSAIIVPLVTVLRNLERRTKKENPVRRVQARVIRKKLGLLIVKKKLN